MFKKIMFVAIILSLTVLLVGCGGNSDELVGQWLEQGTNDVFEFRDNGRGTIIGAGGNDNAFTWSSRGNEITMELFGNEQTIEFEIINNGSTLNLFFDGRSAVLNRIVDDAMSTPALVEESTPESTPEPTPEPAPEPEPVDNEPVADEDYQMPVLLESGYGIISGHTDFFLYYGLLIQNPNNTIAIRLPSVRITARSADGAILATTETFLSTLHPNQTLAAGFFAFRIDEEPATVDFEVIPPSDWDWTNPALLDIPEYAPLSVDNISASGSRFTGEVFNDSEYTISDLVITIIFRDESGQIVGGNSTYPMSSLSAGSSLPFEISVSEDLITDSFEIFASAILF